MGKKGKKSKPVAISLTDLAKMTSGAGSQVSVPEAVNLESLLEPDKKREAALEEFKTAEMKQNQNKVENADDFPDLGDEPKSKVKTE